MKIILAGGPKSGKTQLAKALAKQHGLTLMQTDDLQHLEWSAASEEASHWFDKPGDWCIEGVTIPRALRKWLENNPKKSLDAIIYYLADPLVPYDRPGQASMAKSCATVFDGLIDDLRERKIPWKIMVGEDRKVD